MLLQSAQELMNYNEGEEKMIHDVRLSGLLDDGTNLTMHPQQIKALADQGINCIITGGTIGEVGLVLSRERETHISMVRQMARHYLDKMNIMTIRIMSQHELRRVCKTVGAVAQVQLVHFIGCNRNAELQQI